MSFVSVCELDGDDWLLSIDYVHPCELGVTHDKSSFPDELIQKQIPAQVPGCLHTALLQDKLIEHPYIGDNESKLLWTGRCDCIYSKDILLDNNYIENNLIELCFDGIDTVANIFVNGAQIGQVRNMHRRYRFDIKSHLRPGLNHIQVCIKAPLPEAWQAQERLTDMPRIGGGLNPVQPYNAIRKMSCNTGWDWGPVVPTSGIWRSVRLEAWSVGRLGDIRPVTRLANTDHAIIDIHADIIGTGEIKAWLVDSSGNQHLMDGDQSISLKDPDLWWPTGYGEPSRYQLVVQLLHDEKVIDQTEFLYAIREVEIVTTPDYDGMRWPVDDLADQSSNQGSAMTVKINGVVVYCKGANWIPDDCFPSSISDFRYRERIQQAKDANMNMIRVWGGGLYESDYFYQTCDELGIMVWQDFAFACATYSEDDELADEIYEEAKDNVSRLSRFGSLVIWNGCNENLWGYCSWEYDGNKWSDIIGDRKWGLGYYFDMLPRVVQSYAPDTAYWAASPSNGGTREDFERMDLHPNDNAHGNRHIWDVWHGPGHYLGYLKHYPRFCSEFGFHGQPTWTAIQAFTEPKDRVWDSEIMRKHNKNEIDELVGDGQDKTNKRISEDFTVSSDFDDWLYLSQVIQSRALSLGVGWFRSLYPWNHGALIWQLNDCWPTSSWSMIDMDCSGRGRLKPLYYATRRFFAPRVINFGPRQTTYATDWGDDLGPLRVYLHNDHTEPWAGTLHVKWMTLNGELLDEIDEQVTVSPRNAFSVDVPEKWTSPRKQDTLLVADLEQGERGWWWFAPDRLGLAPKPSFDIEVSNDSKEMTIHAHTLLRDVCLFADRLHAEAEAMDGCFNLLPGEQYTININTPVNLDASALCKKPVLRVIGD